MTIQRETELFNLFIDKDGIRPLLSKPFIHDTDGRVWASNAYIIIMVNKDCVSGEYTTQNLRSIREREYNTDINISVAKLEDAVNNVPKVPKVIETTEEGDCPECDGTGEVEVEYYAETDSSYHWVKCECPICYGTGYKDIVTETTTENMVPDYSYVLQLPNAGALLRVEYIDILVKACKMFDITYVRLLRVSHNSICLFELNEDIHIGIMPIMNSDELKIIKLN